MFERFTERAREVVVLAQDEAQNLRHNYIGTEHLLLGLLREDEGLAARILVSFDITLEEVRTQVERIIGSGDGAVTGMIPFTPRARRVLELSLREALRLKHDYIGTEHILLGLARETGGVACQILRDFDVDAESIQAAVAEAVSTRPDASHHQDLLLTEGDFDLAGDFAGPAEAFGPPLAPWRIFSMGRLRRFWNHLFGRSDPPRDPPWFEGDAALVPAGPPRRPSDAAAVALHPPKDPDPLEYPTETDAFGLSDEEDEGSRAQAL